MEIQKKISTRRTVAIVLVALQFFSYLGTITDKGSEKHGNAAESTGYYIGYNFFLIVALVLFINVGALKKKMRKEEENKSIDSIGKNE